MCYFKKPFAFYAVFFILLCLPSRDMISAEIIDYPGEGQKFYSRQNKLASSTAASSIKQGEQPSSASTTFSFVAPEAVFVSGQTLNVDIIVDSAAEIINTAMAVITYSTSTLMLLGVDYETSDFSISLDEFLLDGLAIITTLQPSPGLLGKVKVARLTFLLKDAGVAEAKFVGGSRVLASDGLGTDVLEQKENLVFTIK